MAAKRKPSRKAEAPKVTRKGATALISYSTRTKLQREKKLGLYGLI